MSTPIAVLAKEVAEGAKFLDLNLPEWSLIVEPSLLDIGHPEWCVLGQCFGTYNLGLLRLGLNPMDDDGLLGFNGFCEDYHLLTDLWIEQIKKRRQAAHEGQSND